MIKVVGPDGCKRRSGGLLLGRQRARVSGADLDPGCELVVGAQIVGTDAQPSGHVPAAHVHRRGLRRRHQGIRLRGSTRTMAPPSLLAAMGMLPRMRKASPPNILSSVSSGSRPMSWRMRPASSWS